MGRVGRSDGDVVVRWRGGGVCGGCGLEIMYAWCPP